MSDDKAESQLEPRGRRLIAPAIGAVLVGAITIGLASVGADDPVGSAAAVLQILIQSGALAGAWMLGALGIGASLGRLVLGGSERDAALDAAIGVSVMLFLAHALGAIGLLGGTSGTVISWVPVLGGCVVLALRMRTIGRPEIASRLAQMPTAMLVAAPALGVLAVACCVPPGTLWASEARGFDVLSYHLQLPSEWLAGARIQGLEHNVYSFLPSYVEAAYMQLGAMAGGGALGAGEGVAAQASQLLHAMLAILAAVQVGQLIACLLPGRDRVTTEAPASWFGAGAMLLTPWVLVTASLAYNEMAVLVCFAGALRACHLSGASAVRRGAIIGWLTGIACASKLSAAYMVAPSVAIAALMWSDRRDWMRVAIGAALAGTLALLPWFARNVVDAGNPVFPFLTGILGDGHWTDLEAERWSRGHHSSAGVGQRIGWLLSGRGLLHAQWALFPALVVGAALVAGLSRVTRRTAIALLAMIAVQIAAWLAIGHQQSRFLLPVVVPGALLIGIAGASAGERAPRRIVAGAGAILAIAIATIALATYASQNTGRPGIGLVGGVALINGSALDSTDLGSLPAPQLRELLEQAGPMGASRLLARADPEFVLYLLGDSTPFYFAGRPIYHTTWDTSPLGAALRATEGDLEAALGTLRDRGVTHILVNTSELHRLIAVDNWYDPGVTLGVIRDLIERPSGVICRWQGPSGMDTFLIELSR